MNFVRLPLIFTVFASAVDSQQCFVYNKTGYKELNHLRQSTEEDDTRRLCGEKNRKIVQRKVDSAELYGDAADWLLGFNLEAPPSHLNGLFVAVPGRWCCPDKKEHRECRMYHQLFHCFLSLHRITRLYYIYIQTNHHRKRSSKNGSERAKTADHQRRPNK